MTLISLQYSFPGHRRQTLVLLLKIIAFAVAVFVINLPFGSYRNTTRKFSPAWLLSIHLPIPLVIVLRLLIFPGLSWIIIISLAADIAGQIIGGRYNWFGKVNIQSELT